MTRRYFRDPWDGAVLLSTSPQMNNPIVRDEYTEEVQVVPLDAVVIPRDELPEVTVRNGIVEASGAEDPYSTSVEANPNWSWHYGINALAVSLHLREHPPIDPDLLKALEGLLDTDEAEDAVGHGMDHLARFLAEQGVRIEAGDAPC